MSNVEVTDFLRWSVDKDAQEDIDAAEARHIPGLTPQDFWNAVYDFDPSSDGTTTLERTFHARQGQTLTLGKIYGQATLKLISGKALFHQTKTILKTRALSLLLTTLRQTEEQSAIQVDTLQKTRPRHITCHSQPRQIQRPAQPQPLHLIKTTSYADSQVLDMSPRSLGERLVMSS